MGGGGFSMEAEPSVLDDYVLSLAPAREPRVCLLPTAGGDSEEQIRRFRIAFGDRLCTTSVVSLFRLGHEPLPLREHLLAQDVIYVGGGSMINLLALWRAHGLDTILREAWQAGIVLAGLSAGSMCWFEGGITKGLGRPVRPPASPSCPARTPCTTTASPTGARRSWRRSRPAPCRPATGSTTASACCSAAPASPRSSPPARRPRLPRRRRGGRHPRAELEPRVLSEREHTPPGAVPHDIGELRLLRAARRRMARD